MDGGNENFVIDDLLVGWAVDELGKLGKRMHVSVTWGPELVDVPDKPGVTAPIPRWVMFITAPNPAALGGPRLNAMKDLGYGEPAEHHVRAMVREAVAAMNALGRQKLAAANGNGHGHL